MLALAIKRIPKSLLQTGANISLTYVPSSHFNQDYRQCLVALQISSTITRNLGTQGPPHDVDYQHIELHEEDLEEKFVKGTGKGGQKINKVRNCVQLKHLPTQITISCQKTRSLDDNRRIARKLLITRLDNYYNGEKSKSNIKIQKVRKKKARSRTKSQQKYAALKVEKEENMEVLNDTLDMEPKG